MNRPLPTPPKRYDLVQSFDALALGSSKKPTEKKLPDIPQHVREPDEQDPFVGGFSPELLALNATLDSQPRPPAARTATPTGVKAPVPSQKQIPVHMPIPMPALQIGRQSLTMQYALKPMTSYTPTKTALAKPPVAAPPRPPSAPAGSPETAPALTLSVPGRLQPAAAVTPSRPRAVSVPLSPATSTASAPGKMRCSGTTKTGRQCSREVKLPETYAHLDPTPALYCYQHKERTLAQRGVFVPNRSPDKYIEFSHYIPKYLQADTQVALQVEMSKAISSADRPGYIYAFQILDDERPDVIQLKVGRAVNLVQRLDQWGKQCGSKDQIMRGCWPGIVEDGDGTGGSLLKGNIIPGERGPFCHRVERLVHIELADLSLHAPYLNPGWPNHTLRPSPSAACSPKKTVTICPDCDTIHKEIFAFPRPKEGRYKGREWELIVKPVIEKWGKFVEEHYA